LNSENFRIFRFLRLCMNLFSAVYVRYVGDTPAENRL